MKKSILNLIQLSSFYSIKTNASLRGDMAKRIMHSVLPAVVPVSQVLLTDNVIDSSALEIAIEGRKDIIKYGLKACISELENYLGFDDDNSVDEEENDKLNSFISQLTSKLSSKDYMDVVNICIKLFSDTENWLEGYGGYAWEKIAKSLKRIITLDEGLEEIKDDRSTIGYKRQLNVMKQILMELNIFDGLAHNSDSVINDMLMLQSKDIYQTDQKSRKHVDEYKREKEKTQRLMDAKELENPAHVYRELEESLKDSGSHPRFNDYHWKMKRLPDYFDPNFKNHNKVNNELEIIRFRKEIMPIISKLNDIIDLIRSNKSSNDNSKKTRGTNLDLFEKSLILMKGLIKKVKEKYDSKSNNIFILRLANVAVDMEKNKDEIENLARQYYFSDKGQDNEILNVLLDVRNYISTL